MSDVIGLAACVDAAYAKFTDRIPDLPRISEGCAEDIADNQVWVATQDDKVIAGLVLIPSAAFMKLGNLAVHPDHGGQGLGRALIDLAEDQARLQGFGEMRLNTHVDMPENVRFYKRLGWVEVSRTANTITMQKHLTGI